MVYLKFSRLVNFNDPFAGLIMYNFSGLCSIWPAVYSVILLSRKYLDFEGFAGNVSVNHEAVLINVSHLKDTRDLSLLRKSPQVNLRHLIHKSIQIKHKVMGEWPQIIQNTVTVPISLTFV